METNNHFTKLLNRYLAGELNQHDEEELMKLIREGGNDELLKSRIDLVMAEEDDEDMSIDRAQAIMAKVVKHKKGRVISIFKNAERSQSIKWSVAAAVAILAIASITLYVTLSGVEGPSFVTRSSSFDSSGFITPESEIVFQGRQYIKLPDGSTAILSEGSKLVQAASFGGDDRVVTLTGEAYFDIAHDASRPFKVITDKVTTTVLGTAFNVRYDAERSRSVVVTVTRGKVQVADELKVFGVITPDQQIAINTLTNEFSMTTNHQEAEVIKNKYLIFDHILMETAAAVLEERYNTKLIFDNEAIKNCRVTARFLDGENLEQILTVVSGVVNASYTLQPDGSIRLSGEGCK